MYEDTTDEPYQYGNTYRESPTEDDTEFVLVDDEEVSLTESVETQSNGILEDGESASSEEGTTNEGDESEEESTNEGNESVITVETNIDDIGDNGSDATETEDNVQTASRYNFRPNRTRDYSHRFEATQLFSMHDPHKLQKEITGYIMTQMTATAGIKKHGNKAVEALLAEFCQLDDKKVFKPMVASTLTREQKKSALRAINLIKEKRCGKLKGRTCEDGRPQQGMYDKQQTMSPTVSTDALMLSLMIDSLEGRDVATADITGAYLHAKMEEFVLLKLTGEAVNIMCTANSKYTSFIVLENGKKALYLQLLKALYGCVRCALLWYDLFSSTLQKMGFKLNPYDLCVGNKIIKQCIIVWYVDDTKISHEDPDVVTEVILEIEKKFDKMTVRRGKDHVFLGMNFTFLPNQTVRINMRDYIQEAISDFNEDITKGATTPANKTFSIQVLTPFPLT
jgi:Reverse transcriptase (RNA-dependent DNA polymerase)